MPPAVAPVVPSLLAALASAPDHRRAAGRRHPLAALLTLVCCGMLCGCKSLLALAEWGRANEAWCCATFGFSRRTPCVNTLHRVLKGLDVLAFEAALRAWLLPQLEAPLPLAQVAIGARENELAQARPLLEQLDLTGTVITGDALFAQRALCEHSVGRGGHYLFAVKDNQPLLQQEIARSFR